MAQVVSPYSSVPAPEWSWKKLWPNSCTMTMGVPCSAGAACKQRQRMAAAGPVVAADSAPADNATLTQAAAVMGWRQLQWYPLQQRPCTLTQKLPSIQARHSKLPSQPV